MRSVVVALALSGACLVAHGTDLAQRFPAGSIASQEQAREALAAAKAAENEVAAEYNAEVQRCAGVFLVNPCRDDARRVHELARREVRRVETEANAVIRRLDAEQRAQRRGGKETKGADSAPQNGESDKAAEQAAERERRAAAEGARYQQRIEDKAREDAKRAHGAAAEAAKRAENVRLYEEKQRAAAAYAKKKEAERLANEKRRAERLKELEKKLDKSADKPAAAK